MPSLKIPKIVDTAVTTLKELLVFATLPYYQVSGILKSGAGAVAIGDPIAWEISTKKFIKYADGDATVTDEAMGTGDSVQHVFKLANDYIKSPITNVKVNGVAKAEGTDFIVDYEKGIVTFLLGSIPGAVAVTSTYDHYANVGGGADAGLAVGFIRIPGDSTSADVAIEAVIGGAVNRTLVKAATNWNAQILKDLGGIEHVNGNAIIF